MILLIDNYDSFTFNLVHYLGGLGAEVVVHRNDKIAVEDVIAADPEAIVLSPGPCTPNDAGICLDLIKQAAPTIPVFGVCLGHQAIGAGLSRDEAANAFNRMMSGEATPSQMGGLLMALRVRGESVEEITGAVSAMRAKMLRVDAPADAIDVVGTGGDASGSFNISTCAAFIVAGAGVPVAKHGNRALSSRSGAADVLPPRGVKIDIGPEAISACIRQAGIGFMFAPAHHPAMKNVGPTRVELGTRT